MGIQSALAESILAASKTGDTVTIPPGVHEMCIDLPLGSRGLKLIGAGRNRTFIRSNVKGKPALRAMGLWYSQIRDIAFDTYYANPDGGVLEIDGGPVHGVQGNTYADLLIDGRGINEGGIYSKYGMTMCLHGGNGAQGSEQCFHNCHFTGAEKACYLQHGYNALNNQFFGGNFQGYHRHAAEIIFGSAHFYGVGFQSTVGIKQIDNDGWDVQAVSGGVGDSIVVSGCRTESLRFVQACGAQPPGIFCCNHRPAVMPFFAHVQYSVGDCVMQVDDRQRGTLYRCRESHDLPEFDAKLWNVVKFNCVDTYGSLILNSNFQCGDILQRQDLGTNTIEVWDDYEIPSHGIDAVFVDATKKSIEIKLPFEGSVPQGKMVEIIRGDKSERTSVTITGMYFNNDNVFSYALNTKNRRSIRLRALGGGRLTRRWHLLEMPSSGRFV